MADAFFIALEVVFVPVTPAINEAFTSSSGLVVEVSDDIRSAGSCLFRQVTFCR